MPQHFLVLGVSYADEATPAEPLPVSASAGYSLSEKAWKGKMDKYFWGVAIAVFGALVVSVPIGLKYSEATLLFGLIAAISAPVVVHKIADKNWSVGMLVGLSMFASFPLKKLLKIDGLLQDVPVTLVYMAILWVIGFGWKRSWR